jgi:5'-3' exonuclease
MDKLPGAPGVGAGGAATLLQKYGSLAAILKAGRFAKQAEELRLYRAIATMNRKATAALRSRDRLFFGISLPIRASGLDQSKRLNRAALAAREGTSPAKRRRARAPPALLICHLV